MKVNNPLITPQKVIDYIEENKLYSFDNREVRTKYFELLINLSYGNENHIVDSFITTLPNSTLSKLYKELKQLK